MPTPSKIDFTPGELLGCVSGALGLRKFFEEGGHELVVTSDKEGPDSEFERELPDADIVISQPFWPAYLTKERIAKAPRLKLALTAGIGSDHVDLDVAKERGITVAEVTYSNSISVAEHAVMQILALVRNFVPSHRWAAEGGWNIADCVERAYDLEGMDVGVIAAGRIGRAVLRRLAPFDVNLHYTDTHRLSPEVEKELNVTFHPDVESLVKAGRRCVHPLTAVRRNPQQCSTRSCWPRCGAAPTSSTPPAARKPSPRRSRPRSKAASSPGYAGDVWYPQPPPRRSPMADHAE